MHVVATLGTAAALCMAAVLLLTGCAFAPPAARTPDPALAALATAIAEIDGVHDATAAPSYDGSPSSRSLIIRIYLDEPASADPASSEPSAAEPRTADLATITDGALRLAWNFSGFTPVSYSLQVWNGPRQSPPYDNSRRVDLTAVLPLLALPGSRVYKGDLYPSIGDLVAKFGARK